MDLNLLTMFTAVAEAGNFRVAADRLGVTRSAISQGVRRLETALGQPLFHRTTRSVRLTEEGERFLLSVSNPLAEVTAALETALNATGEPHGLLRVTATSIAERFLSGPLISTFAEAYPKITLDVTVTDEEFDIVAAGFDAGVRLGEVIERDMIAVPVTGNQRQVTVATPGYLERYGVPQHPSELSGHRCIGWRPSPDTAPYRWEFEREGRAFDVAVEPQVTTNDMLLMIRTALAGGGITFGMEETFLPYIRSGELVTVLDDWLPPFAGFYLYFPSRRSVTPKLRALIDHVREFREMWR
ncbi:LysR family transcriptional regulator [Halomonas cupida]|uniref:DNA-binding transcriptional regulator, LysR family n=1 Tax=Halomonas cupida TaxID=44933 RepID=A0A1M7JTT1_9GAMM|nr:LysR family transcriptional regulator [Halomonas cupida]GEN24489.1 LysR family transcriptional regulator [Halomonas cupida]SHM56143.1 DNA-binding transcriptional regulator, LysR family [Halomonas cupida]